LVQIRLLGPIDVVAAGEATALNGLRRTALLAALALAPGRVLTTDRLIEIAWAGRPPAGAANALQRHISYLRGLLGDRSAIVARAHGYLLGAGVTTDVQRAEALVQQATHASDPAEAAARLTAARGLWRGQPLLGLDELDWFADHAVHLEQLWLRARRASVKAWLALGRHHELIPELRELCREHPLDEHLHAQLMTALYRGGRTGEALAAFRTLSDTLDVELGVAPGRPVRDLHTAILRQDPALDAPSPPGGLRVALGWDVAGASRSTYMIHCG
jgi:DNA-binding SARP family transcriptional activator